MKFYKVLLVSSITVSALLAPFTAKADAPQLKIGQIKDENRIIITNKSMMAKKLAGEFANYTLYINDKTKINGVDYYRVQTSESLSNAIGYVKATDLTIKPTKELPVNEKTYTVKSSSTKLYEMPEGKQTQVIDRISRNEVIQVDEAMKVGNQQYVHGTLASGVQGWVNVSSDNGRPLRENTPVKPQPKAQPQPKKVEAAEPAQETAPAIPGATEINSPMTLKAAWQHQLTLHPKPQTSDGHKWVNARKSDVLRAMDPAHIMNHPSGKYQFLVLNEPQGLTVDQLNVLLAGKGILEGRGQAFKTASEKFNINEIYLISHAFLETAEGQSKLATGAKVKGENPDKMFYNMYGVGAYDKDALKYGFKYAANVGWDTPEKAIIGGAEFISKGFTSESQKTLYTMRWNPASPGDSQYATDISWASANANYISSFYNQLGIEGAKFQYVKYAQ